MSKNLKIFIELTRLNKPIGYMLLFWPCTWGLTIAYDFSKSLDKYFFYIFLFLSGSILMRSAGCIVNDISDRKIDNLVERTKNRPIASGKISVLNASIYACILCLIAFFVLINFNMLTIYLALLSMPLAFTYPLMKRFTYWPQLFLGITFNYGLILGWSSIHGEIGLIPFIFYLGAIFWTLAYDTIYGFQDIKDDEIIGLKSTSIKFKNIPYIFLIICYSSFFLSLIATGLLMKFNNFFFMFLIFIFFHLFLHQIKKLNIKNSEDCLLKFKSNNFLGFAILISIILGKF